MRAASIVRLLIVAMVPFLIGCDTPLSALLALQCALRDPLETLPQLEYVQDSNDPCLRTTTADFSDVPNYQEALLEARCDALMFLGFCSNVPDAITTGTCQGGSVLFISSGGGFTGVTQFYDAESGRFIAHRRFTDGAAPPEFCFTTHFGMKIECDDLVVLENLCR